VCRIGKAEKKERAYKYPLWRRVMCLTTIEKFCVFLISQREKKNAEEDEDI